MRNIGTQWYTGYKMINADAPEFAKIYENRNENHYE